MTKVYNIQYTCTTTFRKFTFGRPWRIPIQATPKRFSFQMAVVQKLFPKFDASKVPLILFKICLNPESLCDFGLSKSMQVACKFLVNFSLGVTNVWFLVTSICASSNQQKNTLKQPGFVRGRFGLFGTATKAASWQQNFLWWGSKTAKPNVIPSMNMVCILGLAPLL